MHIVLLVGRYGNHWKVVDSLLNVLGRCLPDFEATYFLGVEC